MTPSAKATAAEIAAEVAAEQSGSAAPPTRTASTFTPPKLGETIIDVTASEDATTDWSKSYLGLSAQPFPKEVADVLMAPIDPEDIELKPGTFFCAGTPNYSGLITLYVVLDGLIYLPEIKYRRVLNKAFGPGGWGLAPRSETNVGPKIVSREYALVCLGR